MREADEIIGKLNPSFFEITTLMAFTYFAHENVDVAVIETGLGGRLDSTNIISPVLSVVTNVSFDHVNLLGNTLEKIANEKAGILKSGIPAVVGEMPNELRPIFTEKTEKVVFAEDTLGADYEFELKGYCQEKNKKTILAAAEILKSEFNITEEHIINGLKNVVELTSLMGRWQKLSTSPLIIADTGHNVAGMQYIVSQIADIKAPHVFRKTQTHKYTFYPTFICKTFIFYKIITTDTQYRFNYRMTTCNNINCFIIRNFWTNIFIFNRNNT